MLEENINKFSDYPFLYYGEKSYSNLDTKRYADQIAAGLRHIGISDGDRVLVCLPNCPEVIFSYQGITRAGAIIVPVMFLLHAKEIEFIIRNSGAKAVITSASTLPKIKEAIQPIAKKPLMIVTDSPTGDGCISLYDLGANKEKSQDHTEQVTEDDPAVILYTSGMTGKPKGVLLTHKNLYSNAASSATGVERTRGTTIGVLPLAHVYGLTVSNVCLLTGSSVVVFQKFDTRALFAAIEKHQVKSFSAVPAMVHAMVSSPEAQNYNLSSLEKVGSGSAPMPIVLIHAFKEKFHADIHEGYGLSEAAPIVTTHREGMPLKPGSVGVPIDGVEIKIVDEDGLELPVGAVGELIVRGDNVTPGYYQNEEETSHVLKNGWLYTGDLAKVDEDGYLYIVDRKKDLIIRGGFNVYPRDLEELLAQHEAVSEAAVIGVPDSRMGEEILAIVVKKAGKETTEQELLAFCQAHLAKNKTPRKVIFMDYLPRNSVGKVLKTKLRELAADIYLHA